MASPPPGPNEHALVQRIRYLRDPIGYLTDNQRRFGDVFSIKLTKLGMVMVCSPELVKQVYTADDDVLAAGEAKVAIFGKILGSSSTLLLDGEPHLRRRRLMLPQFRGEAMYGFAPIIEAACTRVLDSVRPGTFALHPHMHRIAFDVIAQSLFASTPRDRLEPLLASLREFAHRAVTTRLLMLPALQKDLGAWSPWGRVVRAVAHARGAVMDELRRRRTQPPSSDITGLLMAASHDDGTPLRDEDILDEILTMVAAGHETTAMAETWLAYAVLTRPEVLARLLAEVATLTDVRDVDGLPYLDAVVRESLRFYSLIPNGSGRMVKRDFELGGYRVPAGAMVSVVFHLIHRREDVFARANEFLPERFLDAKYSPYESVSFGGGTRRCLGMPFALFEIKIVLATLLRRLRLQVVQDNVRPSWRGAFLTPSEGLRVSAQPAATRA